MPRWLRWLLIRSTYTHIYDLNTAVCWERAGLCVLISINSAKASPCHPFFTLSLLYQPFFFSSSVPSHLYPPAFSPIYDFTLTFNPSVTMLSSSYITSPFLVSTLHQSCPLSSFLSPDSHYIHFQAPVSCLLPLGISSALSFIRPGPLPIPRSLFCPFITFLSQSGWDGHFTW